MLVSREIRIQEFVNFSALCVELVCGCVVVCLFVCVRVFGVFVGGKC